MNFSTEVIDYLRGDRFSSGAMVAVAEKGGDRDRIELLCMLADGRDVVHVGCADHLPVVEEKRRANRWLHERLSTASRRCLGIDIDSEAIRTIEARYGLKDVVCGDLAGEQVIPEIVGQEWDLMILGEIVEHLDDPVSFLTAIRRRYGASVERLVVTVPNATSWSNVWMAMTRRERINTDHRFWFTPYTLAKVAVRAGWMPGEFWYCSRRPLSRNPARRWIGSAFPAMRDTVVMMLRNEPQASGRRK